MSAQRFQQFQDMRQGFGFEAIQVGFQVVRRVVGDVDPEPFIVQHFRERAVGLDFVAQGWVVLRRWDPEIDAVPRVGRVRVGVEHDVDVMYALTEIGGVMAERPVAIDMLGLSTSVQVPEVMLSPLTGIQELLQDGSAPSGDIILGEV